MDCSKTINFLHELKGLCDSRDGCVADADNKEDCPMFGICEDALTRIGAEDVEAAIEIVQKWSNEHSQKTYIQDFLEKFPKAQIDSDGSPFACRKKLYGGVRPNDKRCDRREACKNCWNETMEE